MSTLSVIQDLNPSRCIYEWMSFATRWCVFFFLPLWNLNACKDQSQPSGGRGGAISRNPQTIHTAVPPLNCNSVAAFLTHAEVLWQSATRGQECSGVFFFPLSLPLFLPLFLSSSHAFSSAVCPSAPSEYRHTQMHTYTELHMNMNIDFLGDSLDVYTQLCAY